MYVCMYIHIEAYLLIVLKLSMMISSFCVICVYSLLQGSSGTLDCVLTCLSKPSHERTEDDIEGLLDVLAMLPVSVETI